MPSRYLVPIMLDYALPGPLTSLAKFAGSVVSPGRDAVDICAQVPGLVIEPDDAAAAGVGQARLEERNLRSAQAIVARLLELHDDSLSVTRRPEQRVVGTCRHFAVLACALLRHHAIASRVRCGFATYFQSGAAVDHWIVEYNGGQRWIRVDAEILGGTVLDHPGDLHVDDFLSGADAWLAYRAGRVDPDRFGVYGTENWGLGEIRGNLVRDLAAVAKIETLPWDDWGQMPAGYDNTAGPQYDDLLDRCAHACRDDDAATIAELSAQPDLRVPDALCSAPR